MEFRARYEALRRDWWPATRSLIDDVVKTSAGASRLADMTEYHLDTGGKRLRAMLPLIVADELGVDVQTVVPFAAACEMLHNATLVHDDLQDGDVVRRGRPTVWKKYGEAQAINVGDAMFYYTVLLAQRLDAPSDVRDRLIERILLETLRVIEGQALEFDLQERDRVALGDYLQMVEGKTSGLFALPLAGAAILCRLDEQTVQACAEAARDLGVLFQIQDDVLDLYADKGREARGNDVREGKRSALAVHALSVADDPTRVWLSEVLDRPREETTSEDVDAVIRHFRESGSLDFALDEIERRRSAALCHPLIATKPGLVRVMTGMAGVLLEPISELFSERRIREEAFCVEILPAVSRTFALSIEMLPEALRDAVRVGYLLCRVVDTIEDDDGLPPIIREQLFDAFDIALADDGADTAPLIVLADAVEIGENLAERRLMRNAGGVFRQLRGLSVGQREALRRPIATMSAGMRETCRRVDATGKLRIRDLEDLEQYCYYVAGTVGELLTALFLDFHGELEPQTRGVVDMNAVSFGLGLQLVNIVKDVAADAERGVSFVPRSLCANMGITTDQLLDPTKRAEALAVIGAVCQRARTHLERAAVYTQAWPADTGHGIRLFCLVPLVLAFESLHEVERGENTLIPGAVPKVSREFVMQTMQRAMAVAGDDGALTDWLSGYVHQD